jgi:hypothetical protein
VTPLLPLAHGIGVRADLPVPDWLFAWGAALVLMVSFLALGALWREPRLESARERPLFRLPVAVDIVLGVVGIGLFCVVVYAGLAGSELPTANLAPTFVYVLFWVGLVVVSLLFGDVFRLLSPWRALARAAAWIAGRFGGGALPEPLPWPARLGRWPAAVGIFGFAWLELAAVGKDRPSLLAVLALAYAAAMLVGMALYGIEPWSANADAFGAYFGVFARLSPWARRHGRLVLRPPGRGLLELDGRPGTIPLLCVMIGTTSFDGFQAGPRWGDIGPHILTFFEDLGLGANLAPEATATVGLLGGVLLVAGIYRLGVAGMRRVRTSGEQPRELAARFAGTLGPIAAAYVLAHYFSLLIFQGQAAGYLASDPLGTGANLFGTANQGIDYALVSANAIWLFQVGFLVLGHAIALALAHDRALVVYGSGRAATRSQVWMLGVMVGFTMLGLWLLSAANSGASASG